jgi:hypothetical protein
LGAIFWVADFAAVLAPFFAGVLLIGVLFLGLVILTLKRFAVPQI